MVNLYNQKGWKALRNDPYLIEVSESEDILLQRIRGTTAQISTIIFQNKGHNQGDYLDDIERIYSNPKITLDFFDVLRGWNQQHRRKWRKLRLIIAYSQKIPYEIPYGISPFNIGLLISLPEFKREEVY